MRKGKEELVERKIPKREINSNCHFERVRKLGREAQPTGTPPPPPPPFFTWRLEFFSFDPIEKTKTIGKKEKKRQNFFLGYLEK
jgi:hypothetical protein